MSAFYLAPVFLASTQFTANSGQPLSGGFVYTYTAGTTTLAATYTSNTGATPNPNPIELDVTGRVTQEIWLPAGVQYKFVLTDSANNQIGPTIDNVAGLNDLTGAIQTVNVINAINSADTANAASANAVKWAYNEGAAAYTAANLALTTANAAYTAANTSGLDVYDGGVLVYTAKGLNFANTVGANIAVTANASGTLADIHITANGASSNIAAANGYMTLLGGIILQWGQFTTTGADTAINFAVPFVNACFSVQVTAAAGTGAQYIQGYPTVSGFTVVNTGAGIEMMYFAIGK